MSETGDSWLPGLTDPVEIGRGGFGVVYKAVQTELNRTVAVKILSGNLDELAGQRFDRERRAMGALSGHPNIVSIYSSGLTAENRPYLVMEFLPGGSMAERMEIKGTIGWNETLEAGIRLSAALETAHRAGVLHRDVKPENVFVSGLGFPKLGDFGIARLEGAPQTQSAMITASLAHASPELIDGKPPSVQSDVYSLASTMVTMIVGQPPFSRDTDDSIVPLLARIATEPLPDLRPRGVPDELCRVFEAAMAKDQGARHASVADFGRALQEVQHLLGLPVTPLEVQGIDPTITPGSGASRAASPTLEVGLSVPPPESVSVPGVPSPPQPVAPAMPPTSSVPVGDLASVGSVDSVDSGGSKAKWLVLCGVLLVVVLLVGGLAAMRGGGGGNPETESASQGDCGGSADQPGVNVNEPDFQLPTAPDTVPAGACGFNNLEVTEIPFGLGDREDLDDLVLECSVGQVESCDDLYQQSPVGTQYESFGGTCGGRSAFSRGASCTDLIVEN